MAKKPKIDFTIDCKKDLYLKKSQLPKAGMGLYTKADIPKGRVIIEYTGKIHTWAEVKDIDGQNPYLFRISNKVVIDAEKDLKSLGRYVNDARGLSKIKGLRNNSEYTVKGNRCFITSIRKIHKGEEILCPYGKEYWDLIKEIHFAPKKKNAKTSSKQKVKAKKKSAKAKNKKRK